MSTTIVCLTPSFAKLSSAPIEPLDQAGVTLVRHDAFHPAPEEKLLELIDGDAEAVIVGLDKITRRVIEAKPNVKVWAKHGVGVDNIDLAACEEAHKLVINAPGTNSNAVAELAFALMLGLARQLRPAHETTAQGQWNRYFGPELRGKTLGIVGFGRIGQAVSTIAQGFGMSVIAFDPYLPAEMFVPAGALQVTFENLLAQSDFITLHMPGNARKPLIGEAEIRSLKPGAFLINAARGGLVDEDAVYSALKEQRLAGYAADAHQEEPIASNIFEGLDNVILTPHIGAFTDRANELMGLTVVEGILDVLEGRSPKHIVRTTV